MTSLDEEWLWYDVSQMIAPVWCDECNGIVEGDAMQECCNCEHWICPDCLALDGLCALCRQGIT